MAGQCVGLINDIKSVEEVIRDIISEFHSAVANIIQEANKL